METTKQANPGIPIAAQLAAAILGTSLMAADSEHVEEQQAEAEAMNEAIRYHEAEKMRQTTGMLDRKYASAEAQASHAIKIAAAMTMAGPDLEKLAHLLELQGMDKEAIGALIGGLARGAGAALKGIGGAAQAAGRLQMPTTGTQRLMSAAGTAAPKAPGMFAGNTARMLHAGGETAAKGPGTLQRAGGWLQGKGQQLQAAGARPAAAAAPAAQAAAPAAKGKPLLSMATKGKLMAGGALAGAGYVGYKGMQTARDYMMAPSQHTTAPVMQNVNQFGYPQY
jgi:hypothetical protein